MQRQIEDLKRKAEQGSQQLQGEVLELELEAALRANFPHDAIEPVGKGEFGGDVVQRVITPMGQACGALLWETKRTKNWTDGWLAKLRTDQRAAGAELAILVSTALPKGIETFGCVDGVWVTDHRFVLPLAVALRQSLIEIAATRQAHEGQETKAALVYQYLTGPVGAIVEKFSEMQADLDKERKTIPCRSPYIPTGWTFLSSKVRHREQRAARRSITRLLPGCSAGWGASSRLFGRRRKLPITANRMRSSTLLHAICPSCAPSALKRSDGSRDPQRQPALRRR
jgi:hypothetical protein